MEVKFIVVVESKEVRTNSLDIMTAEGKKFLAVKEPEGWVSATSANWTGKVPMDVKTFGSKKEAEAFASQWKGHPWWCKPNGKFEILEIEPVYETIVAGYQVVEKPVSAHTCNTCQHYRQDLEDAWCESPTHRVPPKSIWSSIVLCGAGHPGWQRILKEKDNASN